MKIDTHRKKLIIMACKGLIACALLAMIIFLALLIYSQTPLGKQQIAKQIESQIRHLAPQVEVIDLEGHFPWEWQIVKITGSIPDTCTFEIENLKLKLNILSLIFKPTRLSFVEIEKIHITLQEHSHETGHHPDTSLDTTLAGYLREFHQVVSKLPSLAIDRFVIQECTLSTLSIPDSQRSPDHLYAFSGSLDLRPEDKKLRAELSAMVPYQQTKLWDFHIDLQNQERLVLQITTFEPLGNDLASQLGIPQGMNYYLFDLHAEGPILTIDTLFNPTLYPPTSPPITLQLKAHHAFQKENQMKLRMFINPDRSIEVSQIDMKLPFLDLQGHLKLTDDFRPSQGFLEFDLKGSFIPAAGCLIEIPLKGQIEIANHQLLARGYAKTWSIDDHSFHEITLSAKALHGLLWQGTFAIASDSDEERLLCTSQFSYDSSVFKLEEFRLELPSLFMNCEATINLNTMLTSANLFAQTDSLRQIPCASLIPIEAGKAAFELNLQPLENHQGVEWSLKAQEGGTESIRFEEIECKGFHELAMDLPGSLVDRSLTSSFQLEGKKIYWKWNYFEHVDWRIQKNNEGYFHDLHTDGIAKKPFYLNAKWFYSDHNQEELLIVDQFEGSWMKLPILLERPVTFSLKPNELSISELSLQVGSGSMHGSLLISEKLLDGKINTSHFPLSPFSCLSSDASLEGAISSEWTLNGTALDPRGHAWIELEPSALRFEEGTDQVVGKGSIQLFLDQKQLQGHINIISAFGQYLEAQASVPLKTSPTLRNWRFSQEKPFSARVRVEGKVEELVPFLTFDAHRLEGKVDADLFFSKTLDNPFVQGNLFLEDGLYENLNYGTHLKSISLRAIADRNRLVFEESNALDGKGGSLSFTGDVLLSPAQDFPFDILASLQKLEVIKVDFAEATVTGDLHYQGTLSKAKLSGILQSDKLELKIPDKIAETIPHIDIEFIRLPSRKAHPVHPKEKTSELFLDLDLSLKDKVFVNGRGLSSEWKGNLKIEGTSDHIHLLGSFDLLRGKFLFAGKTFNLSEGTIVFNGKQLTPDITLEGNLGMSDLSVTVILQGPLDAPRLSFQSIPHLPTSSLLSRLLFDKDVSEINPVQAYQLAETLMSLSGSGVSILEAIQKSLGIDKLSLVSGKNRYDEVSLQIGKYLYKGVMVTLSQSASSSEVMVEVELKKGFILQAETVQDDGKFTLKWNYNY